MSRKQKDNLAFLFSRMTWPSLMVRERACTSIAELLIDKEQASETMEYLKNWAKSQQLESVMVFALLVLIRAKMLCQAFELPAFAEMIEIINKPSALSYLLLKELGYDNTPKPDWNSLCLSDTPKDFVPSAFFQKYCTNYIPPIYETHARHIEQKYGIPFYKHWAFEWKTTLEDIDRKPSPEPLHFWGRPESEHYEGIDFVISEVYRSAYLRTLAWTVAKNVFREEDATYLAIEACPIDPSLWKVQSQTKPQWWPISKPTSAVIDTVVADIWQQLGSWWSETQKSQNEWLVAQADGRICQTDSIYDLEIRGFFQKCCGNNKPDLKEILKKTKRRIPYVTSSIGVDGYINHEPINKFLESIGDWDVLPAACQIWPYTTPRWQSRRLKRGVWVPAPFLASSVFKMECMSKSLNVFEGEDIIAKWQDWNWNLREKNRANLTPSTGEYLLIDRAMIGRFIENEKYRFCWICQLTQYYREHSHQEYKTYCYTQEYGTSNIIIG